MLQRYISRGEPEPALCFLRGQLATALRALRADAFYGAVLPPSDCDEAVLWCKTWVAGAALKLHDAGLG